MSPPSWQNRKTFWFRGSVFSALSLLATILSNNYQIHFPHLFSLFIPFLSLSSPSPSTCTRTHAVALGN